VPHRRARALPLRLRATNLVPALHTHSSPAVTPAQAAVLPPASLPEASARLDAVLGAMALKSVHAAHAPGALQGGGGDATRAGLGLSAPIAQSLEVYLRSVLGPAPQRPPTAFGLFCEQGKAAALAALRARQEAARGELMEARSALLAGLGESGGGSGGGGEAPPPAPLLHQRLLDAQASVEGLQREGLLSLLKAQWEGAPEATRLEFARREQAMERSWLEHTRAYDERLAQALRVATVQGACLQAATAQAAAAAAAGAGAGAGAAAAAAAVAATAAAVSAAPEGGAGAGAAAAAAAAAAAEAPLPQSALWNAAMLRPRARVLDRPAAATLGWWTQSAGVHDEVRFAAYAAGSGAAGASPKDRRQQHQQQQQQQQRARGEKEKRPPSAGAEGGEGGTGGGGGGASGGASAKRATPVAAAADPAKTATGGPGAQPDSSASL
jgi:hypothetical protein